MDYMYVEKYELFINLNSNRSRLAPFYTNYIFFRNV